MQALIRFINHEATAGFVLAVAAIAALIASNAAMFAPYYQTFLTVSAQVAVGDWQLAKPLVFWINDALMTVFFFLVGLEIKRESLEGHLASRDQLMLPLLAAAGGMAMPAAVYTLVAYGADGGALLRGWAIPTATDIAFALGALALLGPRVPLPLKVFLLALATLDDLGAIAIIAVFYTSELSVAALCLAALTLGGLILLNRLGVIRIVPYLALGVLLWLFVLRSGVHPTLSGVALAFAIPLRGKRGAPMLEQLEEALHPYVKWLILPLFAFANAGVTFHGFNMKTLLQPLPLAIAAGLVLGKPLGIFGMTALVVKAGWSRLPTNCTFAHMLGAACLGGIGFTMSLFIGMLAFSGETELAGVRLGVLCGSLISAVIGFIILRAVTAGQAEEPVAEAAHSR
jgi:Na+:H+ antiporter, NhaA family